jgi:hypothetical protein
MPFGCILCIKSLKVFGGNSEEVTPVPIPNTEVKLFSADGTAWVTAWESRTPPELIQKGPLQYARGPFCDGAGLDRRHVLTRGLDDPEVLT